MASRNVPASDLLREVSRRIARGWLDSPGDIPQSAIDNIDMERFNAGMRLLLESVGHLEIEMPVDRIEAIRDSNGVEEDERLRLAEEEEEEDDDADEADPSAGGSQPKKKATTAPASEADPSAGGSQPKKKAKTAAKQALNGAS